MAFLGLFGRKRMERPGFELYTQAVRAARDPHFYGALGVPDTLDGRFDMIGLYVFLLIHRLQAASTPGAELAQALFDAMFLDMDTGLREMGVSDMRVGKRVKAMWEALHGRSAAYAAALEAGDREAMAAAVARNVWRGATADANAYAVADIALRQYRRLGQQPLESLMAGQADFLPLAALPA